MKEQTTPAPFAALSEVLRTMASEQPFVDSLDWWTQHAFSCEHWIQFELARRLERYLRPAYAVGCEKRRRDIVFYRTQDSVPHWETEFVASIELKWYGNWWTRDGGTKFRRDIRKVGDYDEPAMALCLWLNAWPVPHPNRDWIRDQIERGEGVRTAEELVAVLKGNNDDVPYLERTFKCPPSPAFESLEFGGLGYLNTAARALAA